MPRFRIIMFGVTLTLKITRVSEGVIAEFYFSSPRNSYGLAVFLAHVKKLTHGKGYCNHMSQ